MCTLMAEAVMSVVMLKYGIHRSCTHNRSHHMTRPLPLQHQHVQEVISLTSICLLLKTLLMLELKDAPENMEVTGYVKSRTFLNTEVISYRNPEKTQNLVPSSCFC